MTLAMPQTLGPNELAGGPGQLDSEMLITVLRQQIRGSVYGDLVRRGMYATDASHYQVMPVAVVVPRDEADVVAAVAVAREHGVVITGRGGGTSLAGQTFGSGMVLDFSKHMAGVIEVNAEQGWARVQPGIVRDQLNAELKPLGLHFAPDPATTSRATVGGMINNNSSGTRSIVYGKTIDHVLEARVLLSDGQVVTLGPVDLAAHLKPAGDTPGHDRLACIHQALAELIDQHAKLIEEKFPKVMRRVSGYNLDYLSNPADARFTPAASGSVADHDGAGASPSELPNLAHLICGSEGTLGLLLEAKVRLTPLPKATALCIVHFDDLIESLGHLPMMLEYGPSAVELLDESILCEAVTNPATRCYAGFIHGRPAAVQIVEFFGDDAEHAAARAERFAAAMQHAGVGYAQVLRTDPAQIAEVWALRRLGVGLQSNVKGARKPMDFIDDACVPVEHLADYIEAVGRVCEKHGVQMPICAHASVGVLHPKPMLDLHEPTDRETMRAIAWEVFELVKHYGGAWCGEHGDGQVRGEFLRAFYGDELYEAFRRVKALFDPLGLMNPGKIIDTPTMTDNLRYGPPGYSLRVAEVQSNFHYRDQGGFGPAVEQCNGLGACRKIDVGTMCPSYMATRDENATTRGRANALRLAMSGQLGDDALAGDGVHDALSLCLACKGCKVDCPNAVDMARMKSDVLQMRYDQRGTPLAARLLGNIPTTARRIAGPLAPLVNVLQRTRMVKYLTHKLTGVDPRRSMPAFTTNPLPRQVRRRKPGLADASRDAGPPRTKVVLFNDTFVNYFEPGLGLRAVELLEAGGYDVTLANAGCCQRTRMSKGLLHQARRDGLKTMRNLAAFADQGLPILFIEPSCASAVLDDLPDLLDDPTLGERIGPHAMLIDQFLAEQLDAGKVRVAPRPAVAEVVVHTHCHQKALAHPDATRRVLDHAKGLVVHEIDAGCCGMAGSFGYEHHDLSLAIGNRRLFPAVTEANARNATVCTNGTSCRQQIHDACTIDAKHLIELIELEPTDAGRYGI